MRQVLLEGPGRLAVLEGPEPVPGPGEALVRVEACGICGSDVHSFAGRHPFVIYPVVPGHEFCGTVEAVGEGAPEEWVGSRVVVEPSLACGTCLQCRAGRYNICGALRVMGFQAPGAMCELISVPEDRVHVLPVGMSARAGALVEPCAVAVHAFARARTRAGGWVAVIGAGVIGGMLVRVARSAGCRVVCIEKDPGRLARLPEVDAALVPSEDTAPEIRELTSGELGAVFECVGCADTLDLAVRAAPRGSTVVVVGVFGEPVPMEAALVQDGELELKGTLMYMASDFQEAIRLIAAGAVEPSDFITHVVPLEGVEGAFRMLLAPTEPVMKVIVEPGG